MKMKSIEVRDSEEPRVTLEILAEAEKQLGVALPEGYRQFLLLHNGGHPKQDIYDFAENDNGSDVHWFFAIYDGGESINLLKEAYRFDERIPKEFTPIARDSGSSRICLGVREPYYGQVYFWDFNEAPGWMDPEFYEPPTFDNMYLLAHSFEEFINKLYGYEGTDTRWISIHDRYSWPLSKQARRYGKLVTDFFGAASESVKDFMMEEPRDPDWWHLWYEDPETKLRHHRVIYPDGRVEDSIGDPPPSLV